MSRDSSEKGCPHQAGRVSRRNMLAAMAGAGMTVAAATAQQKPKADAAPQPWAPKQGKVSDLKGRLPLLKIGNVTFSQIIFGGNQIGGWAHSGRRRYVDQLCLAYYTPEKIAATLSMAEECGVNTILTAPSVIPKLQDYWRNHNGKIQFISDLGPGPETLLEMVQRSIDAGAVACYIHGSISDWLVREGNFDLMSKALEMIRKNGMPAGIGAHQLATIEGCADEGLSPDFWMKTFHPHSWGEDSELYPGYDEINCMDPEETAQFMKDRKEPWIAFKTMATGVVPPEAAFKYAFDNGADFICAGMFDWQLIEDINIGLDAIKGVAKRERPWCAQPATL